MKSIPRSLKSTLASLSRLRFTQSVAMMVVGTVLVSVLTACQQTETPVGTQETLPISETVFSETTASSTERTTTTSTRIDHPNPGIGRPRINRWIDPIALMAGPLAIPEDTPSDYETLFEEADAHDGVAGLYRHDPDAFHGQQVYMERLEDQQPVFLKHARAKGWPASLTKILTVLIVLEEVPDLLETVTVTDAMIHGIEQTNASRAGFVAGEEVAYLDLLYSAMLPSAGDATHIIAVDLAGSEEAFAVKMNELARQIGMLRSHFTNSVGLHDEAQYSTAEDLAKLLRYAWANETFRTIATTPQKQTAPTPAHPEGISLQHSILSVTAQNPEPGPYKVLGGKSGYTIAGGQAWATIVETTQGDHYICITLGSRTPKGQLSSPAADTYRMMNGIFSWDGTAESLERP